MQLRREGAAPATDTGQAGVQAPRSPHRRRSPGTLHQGDSPLAGPRGSRSTVCALVKTETPGPAADARRRLDLLKDPDVHREDDHRAQPAHRPDRVPADRRSGVAHGVLTVARRKDERGRRRRHGGDRRRQCSSSSPPWSSTSASPATPSASRRTPPTPPRSPPATVSTTRQRLHPALRHRVSEAVQQLRPHATSTCLDGWTERLGLLQRRRRADLRARRPRQLHLLRQRDEPDPGSRRGPDSRRMQTRPWARSPDVSEIDVSTRPRGWPSSRQASCPASLCVLGAGQTHDLQNGDVTVDGGNVHFNGSVSRQHQRLSS